MVGDISLHASESEVKQNPSSWSRKRKREDLSDGDMAESQELAAASAMRRTRRRRVIGHEDSSQKSKKSPPQRESEEEKSDSNNFGSLSEFLQPEKNKSKSSAKS